MNLLPTHLGTRPGLAVELRPEGIVAARAESTAGESALASISRADLPPGALLPSLRPGNIADRPAVVAAVRTTLEAVFARSRQATLIVPDAAVRVLLLDFDTLPTKTADALPIVRFRLKKLLPFDADDAVISYQTMSSTRTLIRVLAVAMPGEVLAEYESVLREAGFEPGAVLPSTLAALAGLPASESAALVVNASPSAITTAIVRGGILLLHRSVDLAPHTPTILPGVPAELLATPLLPLVDRESSVEEWARQEPARYGHSHPDPTEAAARIQADLLDPAQHPAAHNAATREISEALSVASAYFEDTIGTTAGSILSAGPTSADELAHMLRDSGLQAGTGVREIVDPAALDPAAVSTRIPRAWLAGVRGALRS